MRASRPYEWRLTYPRCNSWPKIFCRVFEPRSIATGLDPQNLELELTETVLMQDAESAVDRLHALKAIGVQLAVDDFRHRIF